MKGNKKVQFDWQHTAINNLPIDDEMIQEPRQVRGANYSKVDTTPVYNPKIVSISDKAMKEILDISREEIFENEHEWTEILSGNELPEGANPISHCYCGHQFGVFAGQLGDGRAITLGDIKNSKGEIWELQLKGSGMTPYSRFADGRAVLRSSIREYLCSEAIHALGIPTTRAGAIITSESTVVRDLLYDGHPIDENCSVVLRLAPNFIRFGSFETCLPTNIYSGMSGPSHGLEDKMLPTLYDYVIKYYYSEFWNKHEEKQITKEDMYFDVFKEISRRTARLVALWQGVGFCHGVLNTDNMSILGLTIDYGPFGFMDHFNPDHICNHSDRDGRYTYENQPSMCKWNLLKLAEVMENYIPNAKDHIKDNFDMIYSKYFMNEFMAKLGIRELQKGDILLINSMYKMLAKGGFDWTNFFRHLYKLTVPTSIEEGDSVENIIDTIEILHSFRSKKEIKCKISKPKFDIIRLQKLKEIMKKNPEILKMIGQNPEAIERELKKDEEYSRLMESQDEELDEESKKILIEWIKQYRKRLFKDFENRKNKDETLQEFEIERKKIMLRKNPKFVLRNHLAEQCIKLAENNDYSMIDGLLKVLESPYDEHEEVPAEWSAIPPLSACDICVSCSS